MMQIKHLIKIPLSIHMVLNHYHCVFTRTKLITKFIKKKIKLVGGKSKSTQKAKKISNFMETENQKLLNSSKQRMNEESKTYLEPVKQLEAAARLEK